MSFQVQAQQLLVSRNLRVWISTVEAFNDRSADAVIVLYLFLYPIHPGSDSEQERQHKPFKQAEVETHAALLSAETLCRGDPLCLTVELKGRDHRRLSLALYLSPDRSSDVLDVNLRFVHLQRGRHR
jgi:hypothetical protein